MFNSLLAEYKTPFGAVAAGEELTGLAVGEALAAETAVLPAAGVSAADAQGARAPAMVTGAARVADSLP